MESLLNKVEGLKAFIFIKKESNRGVFEIWEIFNNSLFIEHVLLMW